MSILTRVASVLQQEISRRTPAPMGCRWPSGGFWARLATSAPMPLSSLCKVSSFDKAQASRVLRALEARDLVALRASEHHKRRVIVDVTATGSALAEKLFSDRAPLAARIARASYGRRTPRVVQRPAKVARRGRRGRMKIANIETLTADGGLPHVQLREAHDDSGIVGWSEYFDGLAGAELAPLIAGFAKTARGMDPRAVGAMSESLLATTRLAAGGTCDASRRGDRERVPRRCR